MEYELLLAVALRATIVYVFLFAVVRILGKRQLGIHSALDLIVSILLADLASDAIFGSVTMVHSLLAVAIVATWHFAGRRVKYGSSHLQRWLTMKPTIVVRDGAILPHALRSERLPEAELWSLLRQQGIEDLSEVKQAILEPSGQLSVVRQDWAQHARKGDLQTTTEQS
ncbi:MAG TPA: YetF domain-containing protein [Armatimonadota bacterium]|nr:YetF domain-containing protein [Armatimonadota bacterium]